MSSEWNPNEKFFNFVAGVTLAVGMALTIVLVWAIIRIVLKFT